MDFQLLDVDPRQVYPPMDDTFLLIDALKQESLAGKKIVEIGCGSGLVSMFIAKRARIVHALDINPLAALVTLLNSRKNNIFNVHVMNMNLLDAFKGTFKADGLIFNPPYLPEDDLTRDLSFHERLMYYGGKEGINLSIIFLKRAINHLKKNGAIYLISSTLSNIKKLKEKISLLGLKYEILKEDKFFFERILILKIMRQ